MYYQFLIEDKSTEILVNNVMEKLKDQYSEREVIWNIKFLMELDIYQKKEIPWNKKQGNY